MKIRFLNTLIFTGSIATSSLLAQQEPNDDSSSNVVEVKDTDSDDTKLTTDKALLNAVNNRFSNLPVEVRQKYFSIKKDAYRYFSNKRTFEALTSLYEMIEIFDEDPQAYNLLGSIHIEFRNFDRARESYEKALSIAAGDPILLFNMAEIEFCSNNWKESLEGFKQLKTVTKGQPITDLIRLIDLKIMLSHLALADKANSAENKNQHLADAKSQIDIYTYLTDSPYYYYTRAALAFYEKDDNEAGKWLQTARRIFAGNPGTISSWDDTLIEFGYITSHYGNDNSEAEEEQLNN